EVRLPAQLVERDELDVPGPDRVGGEVGIVGQVAHPEARELLRGQARALPETDEAERLPAHALHRAHRLDRGRTAPAMATERVYLVRQLSRAREQQHRGMVRDL